MKKLAVLLSVCLIALCFTGCGEKTNDKEISSDVSSGTSSVKGFTGKINKKWTDVSEEYGKIETDAEKELDSMESVTRDGIGELVTDIQNGISELSSGINDENEETARGVYRDAHMLTRISASDKESELAKTGESAKALIRHYYGEAKEDFESVKDNLAASLENIKNLTDDAWDKIIKAFK